VQSGSLDKIEFQTSLEIAGLYLSQSQLSTLFDHIDSGGHGSKKGCVTVTEWIAALAPVMVRRRRNTKNNDEALAQRLFFETEVMQNMF
jgi:hypothetical protein